MTGDAYRHTVVISNPQGFHMRPMAAFVETVNRYPCTVTVAREGMAPVNGKSILSLMGLAAEQGTELVIAVSGPSAADALQALVLVFQHNFDEDGD